MIRRRNQAWKLCSTVLGFEGGVDAFRVARNGHGKEPVCFVVCHSLTRVVTDNEAHEPGG